MQDAAVEPIASSALSESPSGERPAEVVSTHVLVPESQVERLRQLARKTRIAQSEYLREAVDALLSKYGKAVR